MAFPTTTTPNAGDLILVGPNATVPPGLYLVLNGAAPFTVGPADQGLNPMSTIGTVAQASILAVYKSD